MKNKFDIGQLCRYERFGNDESGGLCLILSYHRTKWPGGSETYIYQAWCFESITDYAFNDEAPKVEQTHYTNFHETRLKAYKSTNEI